MSSRQNTESGTGLLVLGMHRSGTSALAGLLGQAGADLGRRVLGGSAGNETGHWEDAFAVEVHERLLGALGAKWSEPFAVPEGWQVSAPARVASSEISAYVGGDRTRGGLWAVKDPRLSLFAPLWRTAAETAGQRVVAVLMLRHPAEVAASLGVRDGIGPGQALMLWLDYTAAAVRAARDMPHVLLTYDQLLDDWQAALRRIATTAGVEPALDIARVGTDLVPDPARRHHAAPVHALPDAVNAVWELLSAVALGGGDVNEVADSVEAEAGRARSLCEPLLAEHRQATRVLWERVGRAEARLADDAPERVAGELGELRRRIDEHTQAIVDAISSDIRAMQAVAVEARADALAAHQRADIAAQLGTLESKLLECGDWHTQLLALNSAMRELEIERNALAKALDDERAEARNRLAEARQAMAAALDDERTQARNRLSEARQAMAAALDDERTQARTRLAEARDAMASALDEERARARAELDEALQVKSEQAAAALKSRLDPLAAELTQANVRCELAERDAARLRVELARRGREYEELLKSRSWRLTRPLRALRRLMSGNWSDADRSELARRLRTLGLRTSWLPQRARSRLVRSGLVRRSTIHALPTQELTPLLHLAPVDPGVEDVFVWAVIDWRFRTQRPQHLARALAAKGHRVFYISNNFVDSASPGFSIDPLDEDGRLFQIHLHLDRAPAIYFEMPSAAQVEGLRASLASLLAWTCTTASVSLVQHPYWSPLIRAVPNARVVYDCMDHHAGFADNASDVVAAEHALVSGSDLVIVTSEWLEKEVGPQARATALIRNAGEYAFFSRHPEHVFHDERGRRIVGYYGAIADWFDADLVRAVAEALPDALLLLVGSDTAGVGTALADVPNVRMTGEVPYADLPYWLYAFDVCLLPFQVVPLTLATNPVKAYEYLAAGKALVSVDLPEMQQFGELVSIARDRDGFVAAVREALQHDTPELMARRQEFAAQQTWEHRAAQLDTALASIEEPRVSVIVLTYNNLAFTQACLFSIEAYSAYRNLQVIVVDNLSTDGSRDWLRAWADEPSPAGHERRLIFNDANLGFSAGNNVGLRAATGEYLVILNNDTYVTPGWVRTLCAHLRRDPGIGLIGPVTNNIGNEARVEIHYADMAEMIRRAGEYTRAHPGATYPIRTAAFFCVAMPRSTYEAVGDMDEEFGVGFFEDDDYCRRVEAAGLRIVCADDVFVHHHLSASFDALKAGAKQALFERNKAIYEAKWGTWQPHAYRPATEKTA